MSFSPETESLVHNLIQAEYLNAVVNYGEKYNSLHEGYAILLEEVEEAKSNIKDILQEIKELWEIVKNDPKGITSDFKCVFSALEYDTQNAIKELAQVGAVLMKIKNTLEKGKDTKVLTNRKVCSPNCRHIHKEHGKWTCWGQKNTPYVELGNECPYQNEVEE